MSDLHMPVGRVYHTMHGYDDEDLARMYASHPVYPKAVEVPALSHLFMSAATVYDQIKFELDAYEPATCRASNKVRREPYPTNRAIRHARLWAEGYWDVDEARWRKRIHGYRSRGTPGPANFPDGRTYEGWPSWRPSFGCWKDHRPYQARNRRRGQAW